MATTTYEDSKTLSPIKAIAAGAVAGIGGGIVFGIMMAMMGALPMVGMLVRAESAAVGFIVHLAISAFIGAVYGLITARLPQTWGIALIAGTANGIIWWILGALLLMPLFLGMNEMVFVIGQMQWMSLIGHILYGIVTAILFLPLSRRFA